MENINKIKQDLENKLEELTKRASDIDKDLSIEHNDDWEMMSRKK